MSCDCFQANTSEYVIILISPEQDSIIFCERNNFAFKDGAAFPA